MVKRKRKPAGSLCLAQVAVENPIHPERPLTYKCAKPFMHEGEHASNLDPKEISYHWSEEDPVHVEREACARIADAYRSTPAGKSIGMLIRARRP